MLLANQPKTFRPIPPSRRAMRGLRGLRGTDVSTFWVGDPPPAYLLGLQNAMIHGYSVPIDLAPVATGGIIVDYVNPDGTLGQITEWNTWPLVTVAKDTSFIAPPQATWQGFMDGLQASVVSGANIVFGATGTNVNPTVRQTAAAFIASNSSGSSSSGGSSSGGSSSSGSSGSGSSGACDSSSYSIAGYCIPIWGLALGGIAILLAMKGR